MHKQQLLKAKLFYNSGRSIRLSVQNVQLLLIIETSYNCPIDFKLFIIIPTVGYYLRILVFNAFLLYKDACFSFLFKGVQTFLTGEGEIPSLKKLFQDIIQARQCFFFMGKGDKLRDSICKGGGLVLCSINTVKED